MRIGELARQVGVSTDTVRFYERSGLLPRAARRDNAYRDYADADVEHLRLLIELRRLDVPLDDAARITGWCHSDHCADTSSELPDLIERRRTEDCICVPKPDPELLPVGRDRPRYEWRHRRQVPG